MKRILCLFALLLLNLPALAAGPVTIGYVDVEQLLKESDMGAKALKALEEKYGPQQREFAEEELAIRELQQKLARDQPLMSQAELDKRKGEIQKRVQEVQKKAAAFQQEVSQEQSKAASEILKVAQKVIADVGKKKKLAAVWERSRSGLLYIDDSLNLTGEIIKALNARTKK